MISRSIFSYNASRVQNVQIHSWVVSILPSCKYRLVTGPFTVPHAANSSSRIASIRRSPCFLESTVVCTLIIRLILLFPSLLLFVTFRQDIFNFTPSAIYRDSTSTRAKSSASPPSRQAALLAVPGPQHAHPLTQ